MNIEIIRNTLYKAYLEDFYQYCLDLGGETATFMADILQVLNSGTCVCVCVDKISNQDQKPLGQGVCIN